MEVAKFKVGDKVRVNEIDGATGNQKDMAGELVTIKSVEEYNLDGINYSWYEIEEDFGEYEWQDDMLSPIETYTHKEVIEQLGIDPLADKIEERNNKHTDVSTTDKVNSPSHYNNGTIEVIDMIEVIVQGYEPFEAYLVGNAIKYLARANFKENKQQDLEKAKWHINKLLEEQNK